MIWRTFKEVKEAYSYLNERYDKTVQTITDYVFAVVNESGTLEVEFRGTGCLLTILGGRPCFCFPDNMKWTAKYVDELDIDDMYTVAKQLRERHLVKEWGDPDEPKAQTETEDSKEEAEKGKEEETAQPETEEKAE